VKSPYKSIARKKGENYMQNRAETGRGWKPGQWQQFVIGLLVIAVIMPLQFYVRFGEVPPFGWGFTLFLLLLAILIEVGLVLGPRTEYHTTVQPTGGWQDYLGGMWLFACAFSPLAGWFLTSAFPITTDNWRLVYFMRTVTCIGLPFITALPNTRYLVGKAARVGAPILLGITLIAMLAGMWTYLDLLQGSQPATVEIGLDDTCQLIEPVVKTVPCQEDWGYQSRVISVEYLPNTGRVLEWPGP
jgi:hypothetical protein